MSAEQAVTGHAVDVLLPIRLPAPWLEETLQSLTAQTSRDWRLIAVVHGDPGGIDRTIRHHVPGATILNAPDTASLSEVLNLGLEAATARFIARIDADDIAEPERLARQLQVMEGHDGVGIVCTPVTFIDEQGRITGVTSSAGEEILRGLRWKNVIAHPTVMVRRVALTEAGGYDSRAWHVEDYELWLRLATTWQVLQLPEPLLRYRIHSGQVTRTKAIPASSRAVVGQARRSLARARGESTLAARIRHVVWSTPQVVRSWRRGGAAW